MASQRKKAVRTRIRLRKAKTSRKRSFGGKAKTGGKGRGKKTEESRFPQLRAKDGCGVSLLIVERVGGELYETQRTYEVVIDGITGDASKGGGRGGRSSAKRLGALAANACQAMAACGHPVRAIILTELLYGPATYRALQHAAKAKAGPLYHHIHHLRLAGLIRPKQRDLYELTRGGRNLILIVLVAKPCMADKRRRPFSVGGQSRTGKP